MTNPPEEGGRGMTDAAIPLVMQRVFATILQEDTPLWICKKAAGLHQAAQRANEETSFSEFAEAFVIKSKEKWDGQAPVVLDAKEIWSVIEDSGIPYTDLKNDALTVCTGPSD